MRSEFCGPLNSVIIFSEVILTAAFPNTSEVDYFRHRPLLQQMVAEVSVGLRVAGTCTAVIFCGVQTLADFDSCASETVAYFDSCASETAGDCHSYASKIIEAEPGWIWGH